MPIFQDHFLDNRNLLEKTVERQANRLVNMKQISDDQLCTITAADIPDA